MSGPGEGSMDSIKKIVKEAVEADKAARERGEYKNLIGSPQTVDKKDQEKIEPAPIKSRVPEVIRGGPAVPPTFENEKVNLAERFKKIEKSATDPQNQDPFKKG